MVTEAEFRSLEREVAMLRRQLVGAPLRPGRGGGGGFSARDVKELPPIPGTGADLVYWLGSDKGGTGNNRLWVAGHDYEKWEPLDHLSVLDGTPGGGP